MCSMFPSKAPELPPLPTIKRLVHILFIMQSIQAL